MFLHRACFHLVLLLSTLLATRVYAQVPTHNFADFEGGSFDKWTIEGDAFGSSPTTAAAYGGKIRGFGGTGFMSSLHATKGNAATGRAVSQKFTIAKPMITFTIGGGNHPDKACVNLIVDGKVVRTQTGDHSPQLLSRSWDVSEFAGKTAHIEIIDATTSDQRGYILVDDIAFLGPDLVITPELNTDAPLIEIPLRVIHVLDSQGNAEFSGGSRQVLSSASVEKHIAAMNEIFRPAKIRFTFDPKEFETRRDNYLCVDFDAPGEKQKLDDYTVKPSEPGREERMKAFQTVANERPDRLTVIVHRGSDWRWSLRTHQWTYGAGFSRGRPKPRGAGQGHYIRATSMGPSMWAHELGHAFGLGHTSRDNADVPSKLKSEEQISRACQEYITKGGDSKHPEYAIDADFAYGVTDTPPNPGMGFWISPRDRSRIITLHLPGREPLSVFVSRDNIMASGAGNDRFTNDQIRVMRRKAEQWNPKK